MIPLNVSLSYYKRKDIRDEILANSADREVAIKFNEHFGKRPDTLRNSEDVFELAKQGATSFHASEELWSNPLQLDPSLKKQELDALRIGWDLIIDVDCKIWEYSKVITAFIIKALKENSISSISCKFSGNKGFHIGVPFEAFPSMVDRKETRLLFPDGVKIIASYLINEEVDKGNRLTDYILKSGVADTLEKTGSSKQELVKRVCSKCNKIIEFSRRNFEYICPICTKTQISFDDTLIKCEKCNKAMTQKILSGSRGDCPEHGFDYITERLDLNKVLNIDTLLISSRHLYRMPYSLHEKSGLVSTPLNPEDVLQFKKDFATPENVRISKYRFLDRSNVKTNEAMELFDKAFAWHITKFKELEYFTKKGGKVTRKYENSEIKKPLAEEFFPPCMKCVMGGMEDGKKRALFILVNYFTSIGWDYDMIEKKLMEWNTRNQPPLREVNLVGQVRYHKQMNKKIPPPNCPKRDGNIPLPGQQNYYTELGICKPDSLCAKIRNPAQYSSRKEWLSSRAKPKKKAEKTE